MKKKPILRLSTLLIQEYFGQIVADVATVLLSMGQCPLKLIMVESNQKATQVKQALCTLIQHQIANCQNNPNGVTEYRIDGNRVLGILRYPKFIYCAKLLYGDEGEYLIEELLKHGQLTMSDAIQRVVNRIAVAVDKSSRRNLPKKVYEVFKKFVDTRFIQRTYVEAIIKKSDQLEEERDLYMVPNIKLNLINTEVNGSGSEESDEPPRKKKKVQKTSEQPDLDIFWRINMSRFHQYLRDQLVVNAIKNHYDDAKAGEVVRVILRLSETRTYPHASTTTPIHEREIISSTVKECDGFTEKQVKDYLMLFDCDDKLRFVYKAQEKSDGWMYSVNILKILDRLVENCLSSIVQDRFGQKSARIFRLLLEKKFLEQKQMEEIAMITAKEAKQLTYNLFAENIIKVMHCPKTSDYAPSRTIFLFHIDLLEMSKDILDRCYHGAYSAITRRFLENQRNKTLLERKNFIDAVITNLQQQQDVQDVEQQIQDLKESFSTHDSETLAKTYSCINRLEHCELQTDETIFLLQIWQFVRRVNGKDYQKVDASLKTEF